MKATLFVACALLAVFAVQGNILDMDADNFDEHVVHSGKAALVMFMAPWWVITPSACRLVLSLLWPESIASASPTLHHDHRNTSPSYPSRHHEPSPSPRGRDYKPSASSIRRMRANLSSAGAVTARHSSQPGRRSPMGSRTPRPYAFLSRMPSISELLERGWHPGPCWILQCP